MTLALDKVDGAYNFNVRTSEPLNVTWSHICLIWLLWRDSWLTVVCRPSSIVQHGGRLAGRGSVQPQVPLLLQQVTWTEISLFVHCKLSVSMFGRAYTVLMSVHVLTWMCLVQVEVIEKNPAGYLSAAEIPLSRLYIGMAGVFFTAAMIWVYTLMKHRYTSILTWSLTALHRRISQLLYLKTTLPNVWEDCLHSHGLFTSSKVVTTAAS